MYGWKTFCDNSLFLVIPIELNFFLLRCTEAYRESLQKNVDPFQLLSKNDIDKVNSFGNLIRYSLLPIYAQSWAEFAKLEADKDNDIATKPVAKLNELEYELCIFRDTMKQNIEGQGPMNFFLNHTFFKQSIVDAEVSTLFANVTNDEIAPAYIRQLINPPEGEMTDVVPLAKILFDVFETRTYEQYILSIGLQGAINCDPESDSDETLEQENEYLEEDEEQKNVGGGVEINSNEVSDDEISDVSSDDEKIIHLISFKFSPD